MRRELGDDAARAAHCSAREDALEAEAVRLMQGEASGGGRPRRPPVGARCCDKLLFANQLAGGRARALQ